jgi:RNA-directed DNA polymerase
VVQASLKLVLEPIFEADFKPCSYGFRPRPPSPGRHRRDSHLTPLLRVGAGGDIKACFDEIDHSALMGRVRHRIGDKRVLGW